MGLTEVVLIVAGAIGLKAEYLDERSSGLVETETGLYNLGVVVDDKAVGRQQLGNVAEDGVADVALAIYKELRLVTLSNRVARYPLRGEGIVVVANMEMAGGRG